MRRRCAKCFYDNRIRFVASAIKLATLDIDSNKISKVESRNCKPKELITHTHMYAHTCVEVGVTRILQHYVAGARNCR